MTSFHIWIPKAWSVMISSWSEVWIHHVNSWWGQIHKLQWNTSEKSSNFHLLNASIWDGHRRNYYLLNVKFTIGTVLNVTRGLSHLLPTRLSELDSVITPIIQIRKLRLRKWVSSNRQGVELKFELWSLGVRSQCHHVNQLWN